MAEVRVKPILEANPKSKQTFYQNLITCNDEEESCDHYVISNLTKLKWELFAKVIIKAIYRLQQ